MHVVALTSLSLCLFFNFACLCSILHIFPASCLHVVFIHATTSTPSPPPSRGGTFWPATSNVGWDVGLLWFCYQYYPPLNHGVVGHSLQVGYIYILSCLLNCVPLGVEASICPHRVSVLNAHSPMNTALTITFFIF